jgi:hypothetical protein
MLNEGNQMHNFICSSGSGTVINYGSGSGYDFLTRYGSGSTTLLDLKFRRNIECKRPCSLCIKGYLVQLITERS